MRELDVRPDAPPIQQIRATNVSWGVVIAELVDNSFDAKATRVEVLIDRGHFSVRDDGVGIEDLRRLFKHGEHYAHASTRSGRYGVGAKLAIFRGDQIRVDTVSNGEEQVLTVSVPEMLRKESRLECPDPVPSQEPSGTLIEVERIPKVLPEIRLDTIRRELAVRFAPAIMSGRQILIGRFDRKSEPIGAWTPPLLRDVIEGEHDFGDGRAFRFRAGILVDPRAEGRGTYIAHAHRFLDVSKIGLEESPGARIHVSVALREERYRSWSLEVTKRELLERHAEELSSALAPLLAGLIARDDAEQKNIVIDSANQILELAVGESGGTHTPRLGPGTERGGPWGAGSGKPPKLPSEKAKTPEAPTPKHTRRPLTHGVKVRPESLGAEQEPFRYEQSNRRADIIFNSDHILWKQIKDDSVQIAREAMFIYTHSRSETKRQAVLFGLTEDNLRTRAVEFGKILRAAAQPQPQRSTSAA